MDIGKREARKTKAREKLIRALAKKFKDRGLLICHRVLRDIIDGYVHVEGYGKLMNRGG